MNITRIEEILVDVLGTSRREGRELLFHCPKCNYPTKKLSVNIEKGKFKCWVCEEGFYGSLARLIKMYGREYIAEWSELTGCDLAEFATMDFSFEEKTEKKISVKLPEEFLSLTSRYVPIRMRPAYNYLLSRGLTRDDIVRWRIGCCLEGEQQNSVVIPSVGLDGMLNYFVARTYYTGGSKRYSAPSIPKSKFIFNELYLDFSKELVIVEGVFDAMKCGNNVVPLLGSSFSGGWNNALLKKIVANKTPIVLLLDEDAKRTSLGVIKQLLQHNISVRWFSIEGDPAEKEKDENQDIILNAKSIGMDELFEETMLEELMRI